MLPGAPGASSGGYGKDHRHSVAGTMAGSPAAAPTGPRAPAAGPDRLTRRLGWAAAAACTSSVLLMAVTAALGPSVAEAPLRPAWPMPPWWLPAHPAAVTVAAAIWAALLLGGAGAGCGLLAVRRGARPPLRLILTGAAVAAALLTVLPPAGSTDSISYATYGRIAATGHSPYVMTPYQLRQRHDPVGLQTTPNWQHDPSLYGPLATGAFWTAAKLGGTSLGRTVFWLKLLFALAFAAVAWVADRALRGDATAQARAHLLWTVNPLMWWAVLGGAHIDGLAAAFGLAGLIVAGASQEARVSQENGAGASRPVTGAGLGRALAGGLLVGAAIAIKSPFTLLVVGLFWPLRRSPWSLAASVAGLALVLVPGYLLAGPAALRDLVTTGSGLVTFDSFWRLFYPPFGYQHAPSGLMLIAGLCCLALAALLAWRLPASRPGLPAIRPALVLVLAWLFIWPLQRSWYDVILFALLAVFPATRLDWLILAWATPSSLDLVVAGSRAHLMQPHLLRLTSTRLGIVVSPDARLAAIAAIVALCLTGAWYRRSRPPDPGPARPAGPQRAASALASPPSAGTRSVN